MDPVSNPGNDFYSKLEGNFGALINNRVVIGTLYEVTFRKSVDTCIRKDRNRNKKREGKGYKYGKMIIPYLYEYDVGGQKWLPILPLDTDAPFIMTTDRTGVNVYSSVTSDSIMLGIFVESMNTVDEHVLSCEWVDNRTFDYKLAKFQFHVANDGFFQFPKTAVFAPK